MVLGGMAAATLLPSDSFHAAELALDKIDLTDALDRAAAMDQLHGLVVNVRDQIVVAKAFRGPSLDHPVNVKSVSKTLLATLTMIAIDKGVLTGTDQKALPLLGRLAPRDVDPRAAQITIGDLISMRSGLVRTSGPNYGPWVNSRDWIGYILSRPMVRSPGERMSYSTGDFHLVSAILTNVTGQSTHRLAQDWLGSPLDIDFPPWTRDPKGIFMGGNNMALSPHQMVRFGQMALGGGRYRGRQVVSRNAMELAWSPHGRSPYSGFQYGYGWFLMQAAGEAVYFARGYGGQMIYVLPTLHSVVAITSDITRPARSSGYGGDLNRLLSETIVPSLRAG